MFPPCHNPSLDTNLPSATTNPRRQQLLRLFGQLQPQWQHHTAFGLNLVNDLIRELEDLVAPTSADHVTETAANTPSSLAHPSLPDRPGSPLPPSGTSSIAKIAQGSQHTAHFEHLCGALVSLLAALAPSSCGAQLLQLLPRVLTLLSEALRLRSQRPATMLLPSAPWRDALSRLLDCALSWVGQLSAAMHVATLSTSLSQAPGEGLPSQLLTSLQASADALLGSGPPMTLASHAEPVHGGVAGLSLGSGAGVADTAASAGLAVAGLVDRAVDGLAALQSCLRRCRLAFQLGALRVLAGRCGDGGVNGIAAEATACRSPGGVVKLLGACAALLGSPSPGDSGFQADPWLQPLVQRCLLDGEFGVGQLR